MVGSSRALDAHLADIDHQLETLTLELGAPTSFSFLDDPRHVSFVLARYKFAARILGGGNRVLEVGCSDGIGMPIFVTFLDSASHRSRNKSAKNTARANRPPCSS